MQLLRLRQRILLGAILGVFWWGAAMAAAPPPPAYKAEYDQYMLALATNDSKAAAKHGLAAWRAAEKELGDNGVTAILAYNYGKLIVFNNPQDAQPALLRAKQLQDAGVADLPAAELAAYLAFDDFSLADNRRDRANALREALLAAQKSDEEQPREYGVMWLKLAHADLDHKRYEDAIASAAQAERVFDLPNLYRQKAIAIVIGGAARLLPLPRKLSDAEAADKEFKRARSLFPPQKDLESFDTVLAQTLAWDATALAAIANLDKNDRKDSDGSSCEEGPCKYLLNEKSLEECGIEWAARPKPDYPSRAGRLGYMGGAVLGFHLGDDLTVHDPRILAEVPTDKFGYAVLASIPRWKLKAPPPDIPECRRFITTIVFTFHH